MFEVKAKAECTHGDILSILCPFGVFQPDYHPRQDVDLVKQPAIQTQMPGRRDPGRPTRPKSVQRLLVRSELCDQALIPCGEIFRVDPGDQRERVSRGQVVGRASV